MPMAITEWKRKKKGRRRSEEKLVRKFAYSISQKRSMTKIVCNNEKKNTQKAAIGGVGRLQRIFVPADHYFPSCTRLA